MNDALIDSVFINGDTFYIYRSVDKGYYFVSRNKEHYVGWCKSYTGACELIINMQKEVQPKVGEFFRSENGGKFCIVKTDSNLSYGVMTSEYKVVETGFKSLEEVYKVYKPRRL